MAADIIPLPGKSAQRSSRVKFTRKNLTAETARVDRLGLSDFKIRDAELTGLICQKQKAKWVVRVEKKHRGGICREKYEDFTADTNIAAARVWAKDLFAQIARGEYVKPSQRVLSADAADDLTEHTTPDMTFRQALAFHVASKGSRPATLREKEGNLKALFGKADPIVRDLTPAKARSLIAGRPTPATRNKAAATLSALWNTWSDNLEHPLDIANPVIRAKKQNKKLVTKNPVRVKALRKEQVAPWYDAARALADERGPIERATLDAATFILLTGLRLTEATGLRWDELNLPEGEINFAADRTKTDTPFRKPVGTRALALLHDRRALTPEASPFVFTSIRRDAGGAFIPVSRLTKTFWEINKRALGNDLERSITPHDLRRTYVTRARTTRVEPLAVSMLASHTSGFSQTDDYARAIASDLHEYAQQAEDALFGEDAA